MIGFDSSNSLYPLENVPGQDEWPAPDRTLIQYVQNVLGLTLLEWSDDPWLDSSQVEERVAAGEGYDPTGMKTFMAVATNMRSGGSTPAPDSGRPSWTGDYAWDERYTAIAVNAWVRAGFGLN